MPTDIDDCEYLGGEIDDALPRSYPRLAKDLAVGVESNHFVVDGLSYSGHQFLLTCDDLHACLSYFTFSITFAVVELACFKHAE